MERGRLPADDAQLARKTLDEGPPNNFEDKATTTGPSPFPPGSRLPRAVCVGKKRFAASTKAHCSRHAYRRCSQEGARALLSLPSPAEEAAEHPPIFEFCTRKRGPLSTVKVPTVHTRKRSTNLLACLEFEHLLFVSRRKCKRSCILVFLSRMQGDGGQGAAGWSLPADLEFR